MTKIPRESNTSTMSHSGLEQHPHAYAPRHLNPSACPSPCDPLLYICRLPLSTLVILLLVRRCALHVGQGGQGGGLGAAV